MTARLAVCPSDLVSWASGLADWASGLAGWASGLAGWPGRGYKWTNGKSPHSTGLRPLSGPLTKKAIKTTYHTKF